MLLLTRRVLLAIVVLGWLLASASPLRAAPGGTFRVAEEAFIVTLGDGWVSQATLTYPTDQPGPFPTVLLTYPTDMDFTIPGDAGIGPGVRYFQDLADDLASRGVAAVRYHSRYVTSPEDAANERVRALALPDFASDAERVLDVIQRMPQVDRGRVFIYGWSFSSSLATYVAGRRPELAGMIVQGPTASTATQIFVEDYLDNTLPYVLQYAPDGQITAEALRQAQAGSGTFAKFSAADLQDPASPETVRVNPLLDTNGDGVLDLNVEVVPNLEKLVVADTSGLVRALRGLPSVYDLASGVRSPVLVLQGEADTAVRVRNTRGLDQAFAGNTDYTLKIYPGLGHALYAVPSRFEDLFGPMDAVAKGDLAAWVLARGRATPARLPATGEGLSLTWVCLPALLALTLGWHLRRQMRPDQA